MRIALQRLDPGLPVPRQAHPGDAGVDLHARTAVTLAPGERALVGTGVALALPEGYAAFVHPRSGLAARHGVSVVNAPGTVDAGYRGEIMVTLLNTDRAADVALERGDRIAQLVVQQVVAPEFVEVEELEPSSRGTAGHGSTGTAGHGSTGTAGHGSTGTAAAADGTAYPHPDDLDPAAPTTKD